MAAEGTTKSQGEELYLVHLARYQPRAEDFDHERAASSAPKERSMSAGEELWSIHCRRSRGREEEEDEEKVEEVMSTNTAEVVSGNSKKRRTAIVPPSPAPTAGTKARSMSLRSREILIS